MRFSVGLRGSDLAPEGWGCCNTPNLVWTSILCGPFKRPWPMPLASLGFVCGLFYAPGLVPFFVEALKVFRGHFFKPFEDQPA